MGGSIAKSLLTTYYTDGSISMIEREDWRVYPEEFIRLENREFIYHSNEADYRGYTVDVPSPYVKVKFPKTRKILEEIDRYDF